MRVLSVLIVEDMNDTADSTAELLSLLGHIVRVARCGEDGLREALAMAPDLILLDIGLPGMSGWDVARGLRSRAVGKQPIIIAATGCGTDADRWRSADAGIDMHLIKPVAPQSLRDLLEWVGACLGGDDMPPHARADPGVRVVPKGVLGRGVAWGSAPPLHRGDPRDVPALF